MNHLRVRAYLTVLPIVVATVVTSGALSFFASKTALTKMANRHLAYKAEQLRDFINSEWQTVQDLGLSEREEYRKAQEESFKSYAYTILRSNSEQILVFNSAGNLELRIGGESATGEHSDGAAPRQETEIPREGWFSQRLYGEDRVGIAFSFEPFGWTIAVSELHSLFFSEADGIFGTNILILIGAILGASILTAVYLGYIIGPLERLSGTIDRMATTGNLSFRAEIEYSDEIGVLAQRFNTLVSTVEVQNIELVASNRSERKAHETAVQRELETLYLLGRISDYNDEDTGAHLSRIGEFSALFCRLLGHGEEEQTLIRSSAPLHDIGKIAIPEAILQKPGKLTEDEFATMKRHTILGYELLKDSQSRFLAEGSMIALTHHERWDGSGYPRGLSGTEIPLSGRIVSIVDVFDALTSERPYKTAWTGDRALEYLVEQKGKQFDPDLVDVFRAYFPRFFALHGPADLPVRAYR